MPIADVRLSLELAAVPWSLNVFVTVIVAGQERIARDHEVECKILDIGEVFADRTVYHETPWRDTMGDGRATFIHDEFPWIEGYDGLAGANRLSIWVRIKDRPEIEMSKDIRLGTTTWTNPTSGSGESPWVNSWWR